MGDTVSAAFRMKGWGAAAALAAALLGIAAKPARRRATLGARVDEAMARSPEMAASFVGMRVVSLRDGRVLYERNQDRLFAPASNTKLFTTALALSTLGPEYRFTTRIVAERPVDGSGHLRGDLVFVGSGDPSMSTRKYPYEEPPHYEDPREAPRPQPFQTIRAIEDFADQIAGGGVTAIDGDVVGDDRRYVWDPYPDGWSMDDGTWGYGAPVSALIVNDNAFTLWLWPGEQAGDAARLLTSPSWNPFSIDNGVDTIAAGARAIKVSRRVGSREVQVWGEMPVTDRGWSEELAVGDPAVFAAAMLRDALVRRGVAVRGEAVARHRYADQQEAAGAAAPGGGGLGDAGMGGVGIGGVELARRLSPPLAQLLQVTDKVSQNLHAEIMLREVGAVARGVDMGGGSRAAGEREMKEFLARAGVEDGAYYLVDGSGLSRLTLATPAAITKLLAFMYESKWRKEWLSLLPVAGVDGTLSTRFEGHPEASRIQAKTGSLSHVRTMSGYAESAEYGELAFSIMVNDSLAPPREISRFLDTIGLKLIE